MPPKKPEQIVRLLRKADEELAEGKAVADICRKEQISYTHKILEINYEPKQIAFTQNPCVIIQSIIRRLP